jgi:tetratricopeptide (TPR) repeat protein
MIMQRIIRGFIGLAVLILLVSGTACRVRPSRAALEEGIEALEKGNPAKAVHILEKLVAAEPANASACANLGLAYLKTGKTTEAVDQFQRAAGLNAEDSRPLEYLAHLQQSAGHLEEARDLLTQAYYRQPLSPRTLTAMASLELYLKGADDARLWLRQALAVSPHYPPALYNMGLLHQNWLNDQAQAKIYFQQFAKFAGNDPRAQAIRNGTLPSRASGKSARSAPEIETVLNSVRKAIAGENYDEALVLLQQGRARHPDQPDFYWELAVLQDRHLDNSAAAIEAYRDFIRRFARDSRMAEARTRILARENGATASDGAHQAFHFTPAPVRDPKSAAEAHARGLTYFQQRDWNRAIYFFTRAIEQDPKLVNAFYNLGLAYKSNNEPENARDAYLYALDLQPQLFSARYMLGLTLRDLRHYEESIFQLSQVQASQPANPEVHLALGLVYQQVGNKSMSRKNFERYLELDPKSPEAAKIRQLLGRK